MFYRSFDLICICCSPLLPLCCYSYTGADAIYSPMARACSQGACIQTLAATLLYPDDVIEESEYLLLFNECEEKNPAQCLYCKYLQYKQFALDSLDEKECLANFHFKANNIHLLKQNQQFLMGTSVHMPLTTNLLLP